MAMDSPGDLGAHSSLRITGLEDRGFLMEEFLEDRAGRNLGGGEGLEETEIFRANSN